MRVDNGQDLFSARPSGSHFALVPPQLRGPEKRGDVDSPIPLGLAPIEPRRGSEFSSGLSVSRAKDVFLRMLSASRPEVGQFRGAGSGGAITLEGESAERSPYRGRITGPVKFINQLLDVWHLNADLACTLLGFEPSDSAYVNDVLRGYATLRGRDAKDRIAYLFQIRTSLAALFRDESVENEWLREPQDILNGEAPMDLLLEGSMENLLLVKEYVELVAGR